MTSAFASRLPAVGGALYSTTTKKIFCVTLENYLLWPAALKTATVNASINRGMHFSLTEAVKNTRLD
jgi:hypothetical protein